MCFLAGRAIATRVTTSPPQPTDGLFYFITDHLGSTRLLAAPNGSPVQGTTAHYLPYGDYRGSAPTATPLTERGYTGHHENREIGLTYMNARFYSPTSGRFLTADTLIPSPTNPQSHNRYSYVLGKVMTMIDPTGHWDCVADANYDACRATIQSWLDLLQGGREVAQGVYLWFLAFDAEWIEQNGYGVLFEFKNISPDMQVPFCGGSTGFCSLFNDGPKINIDLPRLKQTGGVQGYENAALLAHEFTHWYQGDINAATVMGEAQAYLVQALILIEFGQSLGGPDSLSRIIYELIYHPIGFGTTELDQFKGALTISGYPSILPLGCMVCNHESLLGVVVSPAYHFQQQYQPYRLQRNWQEWNKWSTAYAMY
ncbi:MAG: RHS repeat-associated core domain-containing protein [Anaerolineae bacterium]|nr:RHS repeat-associated core domain-containing protein [Anaerolineae bacterium]